MGGIGPGRTLIPPFGLSEVASLRPAVSFDFAQGERNEESRSSANHLAPPQNMSRPASP